MKNRLLGCAVLYLVSTAVFAAPSVTGNTIGWPDDGWYQVQRSSDYTTICNGGSSCVVEPGMYKVINHTTGEQFKGIEVSAPGTDGSPITVNGNVISWPDDGWYQVQRSSDYTTICNGGSSCVVEPGTYKVINHTTGEQFKGIEVSAPGTDGSPITVNGNVISWPDDGWYQVQRSSDYTTICNGGSSCVVEPGTYKVINHTTGEQFKGIEVSAQNTVQASLELVADKTFRISWQPSTGAEFYRVLENPDGISGFSQISDDLEPSTQIFDHRVALYERFNARYIVQACNADGCLDSDEQIVVGTLERAIGYLKASNPGRENYFGEAVSLSADGTTLAVGADAEGSAATGINGDQNENSDSYSGAAPYSGAVYVYARINGNWQQQAYLKASNTDSDDRFGKSVSLSATGNTLVVGAMRESSAATGINGNQNDNSAAYSGAAYVFERSNGGWQQQGYLKASNTDPDDAFGHDVSMSADGNTLAIGAVREGSASTGINGNQNDDSAADSGAVYVFDRVNGSWQQQAYLKASNTDPEDSFGMAVSLSATGNTLVVGAMRESSAAMGINGNQNDNSAADSGAAYVFERSNDGWQQQGYLKASNSGSFDGFGWSIRLSVDGNTLAVGARHEGSAATGINGNQSDNSAADSGAVYLFVRSTGIWQQQAYLKASNTDPEDEFGHDVSLSADGNTLVVGALRESSAAMGINSNQSDNSAYVSGAVYVFARGNGNWQQQAYVKASNTDLGDYFSTVSLSADGNTLVVGATGEDSTSKDFNGNQDDDSKRSSGAVYLY